MTATSRIEFDRRAGARERDRGRRLAAGGAGRPAHDPGRARSGERPVPVPGRPGAGPARSDRGQLSAQGGGRAADRRRHRSSGASPTTARPTTTTRAIAGSAWARRRMTIASRGDRKAPARRSVAARAGPRVSRSRNSRRWCDVTSQRDEPQQEPSMEEILSSIRRIIADETTDEEGEQDAAGSRTAKARPACRCARAGRGGWRRRRRCAGADRDGARGRRGRRARSQPGAASHLRAAAAGGGAGRACPGRA